MTKDRNQFRDDLTDDDGAGWINRFLAEEDEFDGRAMWRLASWGVGSIAVLVVAILATRSPAAINRNQMASAELARQSQQVHWIAKESENKARELTAAVNTLNADRDRLYTRVTVLEQGLDSVTGAIARQPAPASSSVSAPKEPTAESSQAALTSPPDADPIGPFKPAEVKAEPTAPLPKIAPVATIVPTTPVAPATTPAADQLAVPAMTSSITASATPDTAANETPSAGIVRRTEFGVDIGGANSVEGLRAVWRGAIKARGQQLASLQPIIVVKERSDGLGIQLRLVAGPLSDAAEAAKVCASLLTESNRPCETSVYEGQRLSLTNAGTSEKKPEAPVHRSKRRSKVRGEAAVEKPRTSTFSSFFGAR